MFSIEWGIPEMNSFWDDLETKEKDGTLDSDEKRLKKKLDKAILFLASNPKHPGLNTHEIDSLTKRFKEKVYQSYLENNTPGAGRLFWIYGPVAKVITIVGCEPHPESGKSRGYDKVKMSAPKKATEKDKAEKKKRR